MTGPEAVPTISVVVPTRDRPAALDACLGTIAGQDCGGVEVVVVDDASVDGAAVAAAVAGHRGARLVVGEGRGPAAARNRGVQAARGDLVAFTDDDCRPSTGWLTALVGALHAGAQAAAGPTVSPPRARAAVVAAQVVTNHLVLDSLDELAMTVGFAPTSNLAARRDLLVEMPFDEEYPLAAGEDRAWCRALAGAGRRIAWSPEAAVVHHPDLDLSGFWRQQRRYGRGAYRWHRSQPAGTDRPAPRFYADLVGRGFAAGPAPGALVIAAQLATASGFAAEAWAQRRVATSSAQERWRRSRGGA